MMLLCGTFAFTSCSDDNDSNPTLKQPTEFTVNTPDVGTALVDLATSNSIALTWSQPRYTTGNAPVIATYSIQVSPTGTFNKAFDEMSENNDSADYIALSETYSVCKAEIDAASLDKALVQLSGWKADEVPATLPLSIRVKAAVQDASFTEYGTIFSNVISLNTIPYYIELSNAAPEIWYLVGGCIADGKWSNNAASIGTSLLPMNIIPGYDYDKKTGTGEIQYVGYFPDNAEFKIVKTPGDWDHKVFCGNGEDMGTSLRDGGDDPGNIKIATGGYYKVTVDTKNLTCKIEEYENQNPTVYPQLCLAGGFNGWSDTDMNAVFNFDGAVNHYWSLEIESAGDNTKFKVKIPGGWDTNWGYKQGYAGDIDGDGNLVVPEGKWLFLFCDIDGSYMLIEK